MSRSTHSNSLVTGIFVILVIIGGLYAVNRGVLSTNQGGATNDIVPAGISDKPTIIESDNSLKTAEMPTILVGVKNGKSLNIISRPSSGDEKTFFTDADEQSKIQQLLGTDFKTIVYAWTSNNPSGASGQVAAIKTDGSGKLSIVGEQLSSTSAPAINPSGTQVASIGFDNSEGSFGFSLLTNKIGGGQLRSLDSSPDGIALPRWSQNDSLAYVVGQATPDKGQEVRIQVDDKHTTRFTSEKNQLISDMVWLGNDRLALVVEPLGNNASNKAKIVILKSGSGDIERTIDKPGKERSLVADSRGMILGFISGDVSGLSTQSGTVNLINLTSSTEATRGDATSLAGFLQ